MSAGAIIVHSLDHARAAASVAAELERSVTLVSAPGAAAYAGPAWFAALVRLVRGEFPSARLRAVLDCGEAPGFALAALREGGIDAVRLAAPQAVLAKVAAIAAQSGAGIDDDEGAGLDLLGTDDPRAACRAFLCPAPESRTGARRHDRRHDR